MPYDYNLAEHALAKEFMSHDDHGRAITPEVWLSFIPVLQDIIREEKEQVIANHTEALSKARANSQIGKEISAMCPPQQLTLASSFFLVNSYIYSKYHNGLYFFNSIACPGQLPMEKEDRYQRRRPWPSESSKIRVIDAEIPDALLADLNMPLTTEMSVMQAMGEKFICCRCDRAFQKVMTWSEIVSA